MKSTMSLQLDTDTLLQLIFQLKSRGGTQDISQAINSAIELWLREQTKLAMGSDPASVRGYQWKSLFLPEGTQLRSWSYGEHNHARVIGDEIIHKGKAVTPNQFAQSFARATRNAWTDLFVRRPEDKQFKMAHRLRLELAKPQPPTPPAPPAGTDLLALLTALQALARAAPATPFSPAAPLQPAAPAAPPRDPTPVAGWTLPERRKCRFRAEDVAFE
jgi:hypothetical protein